MKIKLLSRLFVGLVAGLLIIGPVMTTRTQTNQAQAHEIVNLAKLRGMVWQVKRVDGGWASAVVISPSHAITAGHVVAGLTDNLTVGLVLIHPITGDEYPVWVVKSEYSGEMDGMDIAILKPVFGIFPSPYASLREDIPAVDEQVVSIGYPLAPQINNLQFATYGNWQGLYSNHYALISTPITFGNSGGGTFDAQGRLVGLTVAGAGTRYGPVGYITFITRADSIIEYITSK